MHAHNAARDSLHTHTTTVGWLRYGRAACRTFRGYTECAGDSSPWAIIDKVKLINANTASGLSWLDAQVVWNSYLFSARESDAHHSIWVLPFPPLFFVSVFSITLFAVSIAHIIMCGQRLRLPVPVVSVAACVISYSVPHTIVKPCGGYISKLWQ